MEERVAIGFRCSHCGKPLPLRRTGIVACRECGGENYVELPPGAVQPPESGRAVLILALSLAGLVATVAAIGAIVFVTRARRAARAAEAPPGDAPVWAPGQDEPAPTKAPSKHSAIVSWVGNTNSEPPCLADVDGDGVPDVVGFGVAGSGTSLMAVGAGSGEILWQNPNLTTSSGTLACDGRGGLVLSNSGDFTVQGVDPRKGEARWRVRLPDKPKSVAFGDGCLVATSIDDAHTSLSLVSGAPAPCPSAAPTRQRWEIEREPLQVSGLQISFSTVAKGSPRIVVSASRGGAKAWEQTLDIASEHGLGAPPHAVSAAGVLVAGHKPGTQVLGIVLLDPATGTVRASHDIAQKEVHGDVFMHLAASPRHAFLETFGKLYALRLPDLAPLWEAGSMW